MRLSRFDVGFNLVCTLLNGFYFVSEIVGHHHGAAVVVGVCFALSLALDVMIVREMRSRQ